MSVFQSFSVLQFQQKMLLAQQEGLKKGDGTQESVLKSSSAPGEELKTAAGSLAEEEPIRYLTKLAIAQRGEEKLAWHGVVRTGVDEEDSGRKGGGGGGGGGEEISPSPSLQLTPSADKIKEANRAIEGDADTSKSSDTAKTSIRHDLADLTRKLARSVSAAISEISPAKQSYTPTKRSAPSTPTKKPKYTMEFMAKESAREEELRKQWPAYLPWPTLDDCQKKPPSRYIVFTSTWLSVTAKKIK